MKPCNFQEFLSFFSSRVLHRGPRILLQLIFGSTLIFATLLVIRRGFGDGLSSSNPFKWTADDESTNVVKDDKLHYEFLSPQNPGGLRMVVFGGDDVATPAWTRGEKEMRREGWTEVMCRELKCSHYLSFIPPNIHPPAHTLISNAIYVEAVRQTLQNTTKLKKTHGPGYDYSFQPHLFPVSKLLPDLSVQVTSFLDLQNSTTFPRANQTIYVFNIGQWDIWSLASLPLDTGITVLNQLVSHVVDQVDRLYDAATTLPLPVSSPPPNQKIASRESEKTKKGPMKIIDPEVYHPKPKKPVAAISSKSKVTGPKPEHFRVFFPALFDVTLAPGWNLERPETPEPNSKAEQMRNAARLTQRWNGEMGEGLWRWTEEGDEKHDPEENKKRREMDEGGRKRAAVAQPKNNQQTEKEKGAVDGEGKKRRKLVRDFITYDLPSYLLTALVEGQLRDSGLSDGNGNGRQQPVGKWYKEVTKPCVMPVGGNDDETILGSEEGSVSNSKATAAAAQGVGQGKTSGQARRAVAGVKKETAAAGKAGKTGEERKEMVCNNPDDHLFYTPLTLGTRAIREIGKEAAEEVRMREEKESVGPMGGNMKDEGVWKDVVDHV
ncbi:hypothetical protein B0T20DRAFT_508091 [Sordaria brevicollis]|uniref:Uncharacterized protein n=1 Tax=Sordaria brevicollis TaxID=83679 RepID=A0AAE0PBK9_SORBR|nr:hypothetical protein B0T20DRAFT_508091 [Sordaria brevicollis]